MSKTTFTTQEYYAGETIVPPATTPTKSGYLFREWSGFPANMIMPAENITISAVFDAAYLVRWLARQNPLDSTTPREVWRSDTVIAGTQLVYPSTVPEKTGCTFKNWSVSEGTTINQNTDVIAYYDAIMYTITYISDGSTYTTQSNKKYGDTITPPANPTKSGYNFTGWDGLPQDMKMPANNLTVTAQFVEKPYSPPITFASSAVKNKCVALWGSDGELTEADAAAVTTISSEAFKNISGTFNEFRYFTGLTTVPDGAFMNSRISEITLPSTVTSIGLQAFSGDTALVTVNWNNASVTSIGWLAFNNCYQTSTPMITLPSTVTEIQNNAFDGCKFTGQFVIPAGVTSLGSIAISTLSSYKFLGTTPPTTITNNWAYSGLTIYVPASAYNAYYNKLQAKYQSYISTY
jgi:hypothetical protein